MEIITLNRNGGFWKPHLSLSLPIFYCICKLCSAIINERCLSNRGGVGECHLPFWLLDCTKRLNLGRGGSNFFLVQM